MPSIRSFLALFRNGYFWKGLALLAVLGLVLYLIMDKLVMPVYTLHNVTVTVPSVVERPYDEAERMLEAEGLTVSKMVGAFNPKLARDVIIDQSPEANALVKPGRRVYLTVNAGEVSMISVPRVEDLSLREAINRIEAVGLKVEETRPDSIPSPHRNTVTRQQPTAGTSVSEDTPVVLWYSTGLGDTYVVLPDVQGLSIDEAQQVLLNAKLRAVVVDQDRYQGTSEPVILRQGRAPGTRVREGFEVRLYIVEEKE